LFALTTPPPAKQGDGKKTLAQAATDQTQKAQQSRQIASAAKTFYLAYPTDSRAGEAKKIEALAALNGVLDDDKAHEQAALAAGQGFRSDSAKLSADRFEVALAVERLHVSRRLGAKRFVNNSSELEVLAQKLHDEFGALPAADNFYIGVARYADMATSARMATAALKWPIISAEAKAEAQSILSRHALVGTVPSGTLTTADGAVVDLSKQAGRVTLIVAVPPRSPKALLMMAKIKKTLPPNTQVIYYTPTASAAELATLKSGAVVAGLFCVDPTGAPDSLAGYLKIRQLPYVFALNVAGKLAAFGPMDELSNVVAAAR